MHVCGSSRLLGPVDQAAAVAVRSAHNVAKAVPNDTMWSKAQRYTRLERTGRPTSRMYVLRDADFWIR